MALKNLKTNLKDHNSLINNQTHPIPIQVAIRNIRVSVKVDKISRAKKFKKISI